MTCAKTSGAVIEMALAPKNTSRIRNAKALEMLLAGRSSPATVAHLTQTEGISRRQAQRHVRAAYEILRSDIERSDIDRAKQVAKLCHMLEEGAAVALASRNIGAMVGACRELRELLELTADA